MSTLTICQNNQKKVIEIQPPVPMDLAIQQAGFSFPMPCGGHHTCGKCLVRSTGALSPRSQEEMHLYPDDESCRLACCTTILGDAQLELPDLGPADVLLGSEPIGTVSNEPAGFAVDIGTTTVAVYLYALQSEKCLAQEGELNRQSTFGADVIARIDAAKQQPHLLQRYILEQLEDMFLRCLTRCNLSWDRVKRLVITGNTTMLHFLTGKDPSGIAVSPFVPESLFGYTMDAGALFPEFSGAELFLPPCISAYVGADTVCALLSSQLTTQYRHALLIDIGTNGEMALWSNGMLFCCSTAAGPAFEGAGLSSGMITAPGAITKVFLDHHILRCEVMGNHPPDGLCGTGALSTLALLLDQGIIDETGRLLMDGHSFSDHLEDLKTDRIFYVVPGRVTLTQKDIRQLQLAKAAISAGIATLLSHLSVTAEQLDAILLCGGFGSRLDTQDAQRIGLLPSVSPERVLTAGNASGQGAVQLLLHPEEEAACISLAKHAKTLSLSASTRFMDEYIERMYFPA